jgi:Helix-turn-helix domain of resolvase
MAGLAAARAGGRKPKITPELTGKAQRMYDAKTFTMAEIAASCGVTPMTIYRNISIRPPSSRQPISVDFSASTTGIPTRGRGREFAQGRGRSMRWWT